MNSKKPSKPAIQRAHKPIALPTNVSAYLFFGGSFDPPHLGHTALPVQAAKQLEARLGFPKNSCHLIYVPAARSPHKEHSPTADHHRLAMLDLALADLDQPHTVWTQELDDAPLNLGQPSYWADTWAIANQLLPDAEMKFLIGADQARSMNRWHRYAEYWEDAVVIMRDDTSDANALIESLETTGVWTPTDLAHWRSQCLSLPMVPWSSTKIREQLATLNKKESTRIEGLDAGVQSYIVEHGLYR